MHELDEKVREKAVLVHLITSDDKYHEVDAEQIIAELALLAETAGVEVVSIVTQNREVAGGKWLIGKGKVQEIKAIADELSAGTIIFNQELSGAQVRNLEEAIDRKIIDRTQLILDIFALRAKTREGKIQVELAQLSYLLPRLVGHRSNLSRLGGGIGTRGPGESKLETDRRHIRRRIDDLKEQLGEVVRHRRLHRERRSKSGVTQVALVGYTNAGKSTLLRELTEADVYVENQLFATLDPTSRTWDLPSGRQVVLTDTVGFIQQLPHDLVAAFRATLEEVCEADLVLHVVDSSSPARLTQIQVVEQILADLGVTETPIIQVWNKRDLLQKSENGEDLAQLAPQPNDGFDSKIAISAFDEADLDALRQLVEAQLGDDTAVFELPMARGDLLALLYRCGEVVSREDGEESFVLTVRLDKQQYAIHGHKLEDYREGAKNENATRE